MPGELQNYEEFKWNAVVNSVSVRTSNHSLGSTTKCQRALMTVWATKSVALRNLGCFFSIVTVLYFQDCLWDGFPISHDSHIGTNEVSIYSFIYLFIILVRILSVIDLSFLSFNATRCSINKLPGLEAHSLDLSQQHLCSSSQESGMPVTAICIPFVVIQTKRNQLAVDLFVRCLPPNKGIKVNHGCCN